MLFGAGLGGLGIRGFEDSGTRGFGELGGLGDLAARGLGYSGIRGLVEKNWGLVEMGSRGRRGGVNLGYKYTGETVFG